MSDKGMEANIQQRADELRAELPASAFDMFTPEFYARLTVDKEFGQFMNKVAGPATIRTVSKNRKERRAKK